LRIRMLSQDVYKRQPPYPQIGEDRNARDKRFGQ